MNTYKPQSKETDTENSIPASAVVVQCSLAIGAVNDPLEQEADAMADTILNMPDSLLSMRTGATAEREFSPLSPGRGGGAEVVQRKCSECKEEEKVQRKPLASFIQRKGSSSGTVASSAVTEQINGSKGSGGTMDARTQSFMQSRFGVDFSDIKIHTGTEAIQMSQELNARAFTVGNDIYFNKGQYNPDSSEGKHLLAHELTHTVQQGGKVNKKIQKLGANPGCTDPERRGIHQAIFDARGWINNALAKTDQTPLHPRVLPALRRNFGSTYGVEADLPLITGRIRTAFRSLGTMSVTCDTPGTTFWCAAGRGGWTNGAGSNDATICTNPPSTLSFPTYAIHTMLHEAFHAAMSFMTIDNYVGTAGYPGAGTDPLLNADSYAQFVEELS